MLWRAEVIIDGVLVAEHAVVPRPHFRNPRWPAHEAVDHGSSLLQKQCRDKAVLHLRANGL